MRFKSYSNRWLVGACMLIASFLPASAMADEIWVAPTLQADFGGIGVSSNVVWPASPFGATRFAMGVPEDFQAFSQADVVIIPDVSAASQLIVIVCPALHGEIATANCAAAVNIPFNGVANELHEIDISTAVAPHVGLSGATNLAVVAFTSPTTATDHIVGMRFRYEGLPGPIGPEGPAGTQGIQGAMGDPGTQGIQGAMGDPGTQGIQGATGAQGFQGLVGPAGSLAANSVDSSHVIANSLVASDLAANSVGTSEIANFSVTNQKLATGSVTTATIATGAVKSIDIFDGTITANDLAANSVGTSEIANFSVANQKLATGSVTTATIATGAVKSIDIFDGTIIGVDINPNLRLQSLQDTSIYLEADTNNATEADNAFVKFSQDGNLTKSMVGLVGSAGKDPENLDYTETLSNSFLVGTHTDSTPLQFGTNGAVAVTILPNGNVGIGTRTPNETLDVDGSLRVDTLTINGADIAEPFKVRERLLAKPGIVMAIDPDQPGQLRISTQAYDTRVAGVISGAGGINTGMMLTQLDGDGLPVALTGRVMVWVDAEANGAVKPGDMLTTSDLPGYAMRASDRSRSQGAILGKAMTNLDSGQGLVLVLVSLQ